MPKKPTVGLLFDEATEIEKVLTDTREAGFDFICVNLVSQKYVQNELNGFGNDPHEPFSWFDMRLSSRDWNMAVSGLLSDVQEQMESTDTEVRNRATKLLEKEVAYVQHLGLNSAIINLHPGKAENLARFIYSKVSNDGGNHSTIVIWVRMPLAYGSTPPGIMNGDHDYYDVGEGLVDGYSSWANWNKFRTAGNGGRRTYPVLDLPEDLPEEDEIQRWLGEPVKALLISEKIFTTNSKGFPMLSKRHQDVIKSFFEIGARLIVTTTADKSPLYYLNFQQYAEYTYGLLTDWENDPIRKYTKGYEDYLQSPLQPLMDNLEATTYEVFERDPTKYFLYQEAVAEALKDRVPEEEKDTKTVTVMVVGAGRGPLVKNCLAAAESVNRKIKLYAVEKNVNAVCTLLHLKQLVWGDKVTVISSDMREWNPKEKADILVSELLGSFGDNELSPECLDGAQKFLKEDGIMIPQSYTSFVSPIMCPKLHMDVRTFLDVNKHRHSHYETPYVVYLKNFFKIDEPKQLFKFIHPKADVNDTNDRYGSLEFTAKADCIMHGFAGYFESVLYGNILMSIHPDTHSKEMFSWFPIYFPIREPLQIKKGDKIQCNFWRCSNKHKVWYEWGLNSPAPVPIHNVNGRSYTIGL